MLNYIKISMVGGGLLQLIAYGAQGIILNDPTHSYINTECIENNSWSINTERIENNSWSIDTKIKNYKLNKKSNKKIECCICYDEHDKNVYKTYCGHVYCKSCLDRSLKINKTCPYCRSVLVTKESTQMQTEQETHFCCNIFNDTSDEIFNDASKKQKIKSVAHKSFYNDHKLFIKKDNNSNQKKLKTKKIINNKNNKYCKGMHINKSSRKR
jgi:hypothetical protein